MTVDPSFNSAKVVKGGVQWYMMETKDFISKINFKLKNQVEIQYHSVDKMLLLDNQKKKSNASEHFFSNKWRSD